MRLLTIALASLCLLIAPALAEDDPLIPQRGSGQCTHINAARRWAELTAIFVDWSEVTRVSEWCGRCGETTYCERFIWCPDPNAPCTAVDRSDVLPCD